ncbi:penicillopepsin [Apodospora peruviana]|uniref:Penicillopepsin n=1 Tax=Apodospora peruviana TaxID=516989 RepID=A0AAE0HSY3_9PEZI|nr:penicillopepsin [Apodospora peruviana]
MQPTLFNLFLLLGLFGPLALAAPTAHIQKRSFKVGRVRNVAFKGHNGPRQLLKAYRKYRMPLPPALLDAIKNQPDEEVTAEDVITKAKGNRPNGRPRPTGFGSKGNGTGSDAANITGVGLVSATPEKGDVEYLSPITIGGQTVNVDFDSGSADLWVFNTQLGAAATSGHTLYNPMRSSTFKMLPGATFEIKYGDGSGAAGNVGTDTVDVGGVVVKNQAVELATDVTQSFIDDAANNGLLGLAFSQLNTVQPQQQKTFFDNVLPSLAEPLFTADLRKGTAGAYEFGRIDATKFTGDMTWIPVDTANGFWQFPTAGFAVGGDGTNLQQTQTAAAIADTGTTLMLVSQDVADGYYSQVDGAENNAQVGGITIPCDAALPDLFVDVGGVYTARIKGEDINFARVQGNICFGGVQPTTSELQIWGDIFFKSQFVAFNAGNNTLGMALHV